MPSTDTPSPSSRPRRGAVGSGRDGDPGIAASDDRDRDEQGRPENARPRDRTGRPLARDTTETELVEEVHYDTVEEALAWGVRRWDQGRFFEAHECLEDVWHWSTGDDEAFWQGVIQVAVTYVHHQRGNPYGVVATVDKAMPKLAGRPDRHHGIDVAGLRRWLAAASRTQQEVPGAPLAPPSLGLDGRGAWLHHEPSTTPLGRRGGAHRGTLSS